MANFDPSIFPKDLTMTLESNHIINEVKEFANREDFIFVPNGGPFYTDSLIIKNTQNGQLLKPIIDYQLLYLNEQATMESNKNVVAVIRVLNTNVPSVNLNYRVIGGEYGNTVAGILQELRNAGPLDNNVDWEINVFKKPEVFPAAPHYHNANDFTDWSNVWVQLEGIRTAIIHSDLPSWASVYRYFDLRLQTTTNLYQNMLNNLPKVSYTYNEADAKFVSWDGLGSWMGANYYNISQINTQVNAINNSISSGDQNTLAAAKSYTDTKLTTAVANANNYALTVANNSYSAALADSKVYTDSKFSQSTSYADQKLVDAKAYTDSKIAAQGQQLTIAGLLADSRFQAYKVGDVFSTTNNYANGAAVTQRLGYGTWRMFAQGRVLIGQSTSPVTDVSGNSAHFATIGSIGGEYKHGITVAEMASHKHSPNEVFNKYVGTLGDFDAAGWNTSALDNFANTPRYWMDDPESSNELVIKGTDITLNRMLEQEIGDGVAHNNIQPYVVVQYWLRVTDGYVDPTYNIYWTTDAAGNNKVSTFNETDNIYLWLEATNISGSYPLSDISISAIVTWHTALGIKRRTEVRKLYQPLVRPTQITNGKNLIYSINVDGTSYFSDVADLKVRFNVTDTVITTTQTFQAVTAVYNNV